MRILINSSEIILKGKNRPFFERKLRENIRHVLKSEAKLSIKNLHGRFLLQRENGSWQAISEKLTKVFGIANFAPIYEVKSSQRETLKASLLKRLKNQDFQTFALRVKRLDKNFPLTSREIANKIGDFLRKKLEKKVNLKKPNLNIYIDVYRNSFYYYFEKKEGPRGLPVGTGGRVLSLLSGGIDSAVSSWLMARRGCLVDFLHFHAQKENKKVFESKINSLFRILKSFTLYSKIYLVPYLPFQIALLNLKTKNELVLFRRFMLKVGEALARKQDYQALVTGDNLGQVASQTMENLAVTEQAVNLPVFRPLLTYNKQETIDLAKKIGTYEISIKPYKDCCSLIQKHPKTKSKLEEVLAEEKRLNIEEILKETLLKLSIQSSSH